MLNWVSMPATQVSGTVFNSLDDDNVINALDFSDFEDRFKTIGRNSMLLKKRDAPGTPTRSIKGGVGGEDTDSPELAPTMLDGKRIQNVAIARRKVTTSVDKLRKHIAV